MAFWSNATANPARKYRFKLGPAGINWWYTNSVTLPSFEINSGEYQLLNHKFKYPGILTWNPVTINIVDTADSVKNLKKTLAAQDFAFLQKEGMTKFVSEAVRSEMIGKQIVDDLDKAIRVINEEASKKELDLLEANPWSSVAIEKGVNKSREDKIQEKRQAAALQQQQVSVADTNDFVIEQLKADGKTLRAWTLVNAFITSVNYGELDYSSDDLVSIEINVAYDYATTDK
jgi:hypothetical protein